MKQFVNVHPWKIIEEGFDPSNNLNAESIFSIGNGKMGQRANFEEDYSGASLKGNYLAGIYYPDKTRVGWWKNGYPEYFAKVLNAVEWIGMHIYVEGELLDIANCEVMSFTRVLDMQRGVLERDVTVKMKNNRMLKLKSIRFYSMKDDDMCLMKYSIQPLNFDGVIQAESYLDFNVHNQDANYNEQFWSPISQSANKDILFVQSQTKKTNFVATSAMVHKIYRNGSELVPTREIIDEDQKVGHRFLIELKRKEVFCIEKYVSVVSSFHYNINELDTLCTNKVTNARNLGFDYWMSEQEKYWFNSWKNMAINIEGDDKALQALRFNIFQLSQSYTGKDHRLNISPKGFTGEKYGGSTYWDTEAYCLPFYLATAPVSVSRNLVIYRFKHLDKAIENASKLGFSNGAALYPMVTMNGEECHNEWEITFEEIHRNGAIAYAIYDYIRYTGDRQYLEEGGLQVLIAIARFWAQRVHYSENKNKYVLHGVTGPNEYENNVNNNWYTSYMARWCMIYTLNCIEDMLERNPSTAQSILSQIHFNLNEESNKWKAIIDNLYLPWNEEYGVFVQQDGFLDKELIPVDQLDPKHLPLVKNWSWDRILRSCYIKQADVLQGLYFFEEEFTKDELKRNFEFYEPMTVHESSLSPCVHSILAASLDKNEKAYEMFMQSARLDLDDYNGDTEDGCHITSMAGTWLAFVKGFGGMRVKEDRISLAPSLPKDWKSYSFSINFRQSRIMVSVNEEQIIIEKEGGGVNEIRMYDELKTLKEGKNIFQFQTKNVHV